MTATATPPAADAGGARALDRCATRPAPAGGSRNALASPWMIGSVARRARSRWASSRSTSWPRASRSSAGPSSRRTCRSSPTSPAAGIWPAIAGHAAPHRAPPPRWRSRSACSPRSTSTSTASRGRRARVIRFMADVMTGVPSIVMGLFVALIWVSAGLHAGFSTFAGALGARVPDAADRDPHERRDAEARARRSPPGERRVGARRSQTVCARRAARRAAGHRERRDARRRPRRGRDRTAAVHDRHLPRVQPEPLRGRTPRCRRRSGTTRSSRTRRRRTERGARRSR